MTGVGFGGSTSDLEATQNALKGIQDASKKISDGASKPVPGKSPKTMSPAHLEDAGFIDRSMDGGVSEYSPSKGGLKLKLGASVANVPFVDLMDGANNGSNSDNPLSNPLLKDYHPNAGVNAEIKLERERWSLGVNINGAAAAQTQGIEKNAGDFAKIYDQSKGLESKLAGLETQVSNTVTQMQGSQNFKRAEELIAKMSADSSNIRPEDVNELKAIMNSGEMQGLLKNLQSTMGQVNSAVGDANKALGILGDGQRSLIADAAVRGAAELTGGYRTKRVPIGNGWGIRGGIEGAVILPMPNPVKTPGDSGMPQFKSMMAKASTHVNITTSGLGELSQRLSAIQQNLSTLEAETGKNSQAITDAQNQLNGLNPNNPNDYKKIMDTLNELSKASTQASAASQDLNKNLQGLNTDLNNVKVETSVTVKTVTPTSPIGLGIKDVGATVDGPLGSKHWLGFSGGFLNPYGVLMGERNTYNLEKSPDNKYNLKLANSEKGNVFHDFYDPTVYVGANIAFNKDTWHKTQVNTRFEQSLSSDVVRGSLIVKQNMGPFSLRAGVINNDLKEGSSNLMYLGGLGVGSMANPDIVTIDAATNSLDKNKVDSTAVRAGINLHF
jgi:archaellum component FlaC